MQKPPKEQFNMTRETVTSENREEFIRNEMNKKSGEPQMKDPQLYKYYENVNDKILTEINGQKLKGVSKVVVKNC